VASYYGTQSLTEDNRHETVYGGSDLVVVRGDYEILLNLELAPQIRAALAHARRRARWHCAVREFGAAAT
jgi:hypothetical protein